MALLRILLFPIVLLFKLVMNVLEIIARGLAKAIKFVFVWFVLLPVSILVTLAYKK